MGQGDRIGHIFLCLIAGKAEHHTLVSGTDGIQLILGHGLLSGFQGFVYAHGNIRGLLVDGDHNAAGIAVEAVFSPVIADLADRLADDLLDVHICVGGDLTHDHHKACGGAGLTCHTAHGVLLHQCVQDRIRDRVAHFIRMSLCYGLRCKKSLFHFFSSLVSGARRARRHCLPAPLSVSRA